MKRFVRFKNEPNVIYEVCEDIAPLLLVRRVTPLFDSHNPQKLLPARQEFRDALTAIEDPAALQKLLENNLRHLATLEIKAAAIKSAYMDILDHLTGSVNRQSHTPS
jgi:hypothetical protein